MSTFQENLVRIEDRISEACNRAGRARDSVRLMAVSKTHPAEAIAEAVAAGVNLIGENRVQEFESKRPRLAELGITPAEIHLIGHLQSNKSARAAELFSVIDTVDSVRLAHRLNETAGKLGRQLPILIEIKLSSEAAKSGLEPACPDLRTLLEGLPDLGHLRLRGLMTIPPLDENPATARASFRTLRILRETLAQQFPRLDFGELSMGMSGDYEIAIEEGSTMVRIGTALFGERPRK